jgi:hypothetical protein
MRSTFRLFWVCKLTGKPAFFTIADSESEAPRIHLNDYVTSEQARIWREEFPKENHAKA